MAQPEPRSAPEPRSRSHLDRIQVRGLRVLGTHGVLAEEQHRRQPFEVDLDLALDLSPAGHSDELAGTVDYGSLTSRVAEVIGKGHFALLEALAEAIAEVALADGRVVEVQVSVRKLRPPIPLDVAWVGVVLTRSRPEPPPGGAQQLRSSSAVRNCDP